MKPAAFDYYRARDLADAIAALVQGSGGAKALAGGCSLGPMLNLRLARPGMLVDIRGVAEFRELTQGPDGLSIGACWTHAEIEDGVVPDVTRGFMRHVARGVAYRPVRNRGTLGGSLTHADPAADWITAMAALDAKAVIAGKGGERHEAVRELMRGAYTTSLADDELVTAVIVPVLSASARWSYEKLCRKTGEFALAIGAAVVDPERDYASVVCGAVEASPLALPETSAALKRGVADAIATASKELDALLAGRDACFRQLHAVAVKRALARMTP